MTEGTPGPGSNAAEYEAVCADCWCPCWRRWDAMDTASCTALVFLLVGATLATVGYVVPRNYVFDSKLPASEMEKIERKYGERSNALDMCILAGMIFVVASGLTMATTAIYVMCLDRRRRQEESEDAPLTSSAQPINKDYGSQEPSAPPEEGSAPPME